MDRNQFATSKAENVLKALEAWLLRVTGENTKATPEELRALPEVAKVYLSYSTSSH